MFALTKRRCGSGVTIATFGTGMATAEHGTCYLGDNAFTSASGTWPFRWPSPLNHLRNIYWNRWYISRQHDGTQSWVIFSTWPAVLHWIRLMWIRRKGSLQIAVWWCARRTCSTKESLVGGRDVSLILLPSLMPKFCRVSLISPPWFWIRSMQLQKLVAADIALSMSASCLA